MCTGADRFGNITGKTNAAVCNQRHTAFGACSPAILYGGKLRHADSGHEQSGDDADDGDDEDEDTQA